jgi:Tfp pilus assembly protein PilF
MVDSRLRKRVNRIASVLAVAALLTSGCAHKSGLPDTGSPAYAEFCTAFYTGLAGLQSGEDVRAKDDLTRASQLAPGEPTAWANLSVFQLRRQEYDAALTSAEKALGLAPDNSRIEALLGQIQSKRGDVSECVGHFKRAISLDNKNLKAIYALALESERQGSDAEAERALDRLLAARPANTVVLLEVARLSAKLGDAERVRKSLQALQAQAGNWPDVAQKQLAALQHAAAGPDVRAAAVPVQFLRNVLLRVPAYQRSMDEVRTPTTVVFEPFLIFLRLPSPSSEPAKPDTQLKFQSQPLSSLPSGKVTWLGAVALNDEDKPSIIWADTANLHIGDTVQLPIPLDTKEQLTLHAVVGADLNYDFKTDLVVATSGGLKIYRQSDPRHFTDVTSQTKLDEKTLHGVYTGAWAFDFDLDGDLDIVLGVPEGEPLVLRNNGDGTFATQHPFKGIDGLLSFAAADVDGDGDPDVAIIDKNGLLKVFSNERLGNYRQRDVPASVRRPIRGLAAADVNGDGLPDFIVLRDDLTISRLSAKPDSEAWDVADLVRASRSPDDLLTADLDNNGAIDLIAGDQVFLNDGKHFIPLESRLPGSVRAATDLNDDGRLDLITLNGNSALQLVNRGATSYHWQTIRTRAASATGDQRINSFGVGGEIEVRADLLTEKQVITSPILHFGLGEHTSVNFARIVWPNGFVQAEFELKADQSVLAQQRLKGSCPFLFAWDGERMRFVKDAAPWSPALGLHINAQQVAGIYQTQEWFKIPGDAIKPRNGYYDLRVTAEYWETFYIDHYSLLVVDHPKGTQVYSDERFAVPPPPLKVYATKDPKPFLCATDDDGHDATETVRALDGQYLDNFGRGQYQGVTRDHWVELQLPPEAPKDGPLYLIAHGWLHPSDGTTNMAMSQNSAPPPDGLSIEVADKKGKWIQARRGLGFPAGRVKTIVLDITDLWKPGAERKLRLRTNMEIFWDKLEWAPGIDPNSTQTRRLDLIGADLEFRGFSEMKKANISSPELPDYNVLAANGQRWRDMQGYFTRYGDVRELLAKIDDRIVITNAGDELRLKFAAQPPPPAGWLRDYILVGDGWIKDGDYNSVFSKTVLPLPFHAMKDYTVAPKTLEDDHAYRLHPSDWQFYHTRYITATNFVTALWGY